MGGGGDEDGGGGGYDIREVGFVDDEDVRLCDSGPPLRTHTRVI